MQFPREKVMIQLAPYHCNECMDAPSCKEPIHPRSWRRHHVGVFLRPLFGFLLHSELRPILAWYLLLQSLAVRGRIEPCGFLEDPRLRGPCRGISTDRKCTVNYLRCFRQLRPLSVLKHVPSGEEEVWN